MMSRSRVSLLAASAAALALTFSTLAVDPAAAQERKSLRWATSSVDSYGYKIAATMAEVTEKALGGEYTVTVNPYPSTTGAMKAVMDGDGRCSVAFAIPLCRETPDTAGRASAVDEVRTADPTKSLSNPPGIA